MNLRDAILYTLTYSDIFDHPLTVEEIHQRLVGTKASLDQVQAELAKMVAVAQQEGFWFLQGRATLVALRKKRDKITADKLKKMRFGVTLLRLVPWIQYVGVTGSVAAGSAQTTDDIDLFIVTSEKRLWLSRILATALLDLFMLRRRKHDDEVQDKLCLNMFLSKDDLSLHDQDIYNAYELIQLKPVWWKENVQHDLFAHNKWVQHLLPNYSFPPKRKLLISGTLLHFVPLDYLEHLVYRFQQRRMRIRGNEHVSPTEIKFHPLNTKFWILNEFYSRVRSV